MTKKRFTETVSTGIVKDNATGKEYNCEFRIDDKLLKLLNDLSDENEHLKYSLVWYKFDLKNYKNKCKILEKENVQLKNDEEKYTPSPIVLNTHISDEEFERFKKILTTIMREELKND